MIKEDEQKKEQHRLKVVQNASANAELANKRFIDMQKKAEEDRQLESLLNARKLEVEAKLQDWEREKHQEKRKKLKQEVDFMLKERAAQKVQGKNPLTAETMKQLKLDKSQINKLIL